MLHTIQVGDVIPIYLLSVGWVAARLVGMEHCLYLMLVGTKM